MNRYLGAIAAALAALTLTTATGAFAQTETLPPPEVIEQPAPEAILPPDATPAPEAPGADAEPVLGAPPTGQGQIVFYRPPRFVGGGLSYSVREGDTGIGRLGSGRYFIHNTTPGIHEYNISGETSDTLRLEIEEGEVYYILQNVNVGALTGRPTLTPSNQEHFAGYTLRVSTQPGVDRRRRNAE